jgi:alpha-beta hydrolase superfamily lysophospholipase
VSAASFDATLVRESLADLDLEAEPQAPSGQTLGYLDHYGIGFADRYPGLSHHFGMVATPNHRIAVQCWQPREPQGSVVVVHGYFDHVGLFGHLIRFLLDRNLAVLGFDLPGHGLSSGAPATIETFDHYVDALDACVTLLADRLPTPWHVIGQSTGAAVAMQWLLANNHTRDSSPFEKIVLLAPLVRPYGWSISRFVYLVLRRFISERPRVFARNSENPEFLRFLREDDPLQSRILPVQWVRAMVDWKQCFEAQAASDLEPLVVQGQNDTTVDWRYNLRVINRLFAPHVVYLRGARHHLVNESPEIRAQLFAAIADELS